MEYQQFNKTYGDEKEYTFEEFQEVLKAVLVPDFIQELWNTRPRDVLSATRLLQTADNMYGAVRDSRFTSQYLLKRKGLPEKIEY